jgi:hypothetical protein
MIKLSDIVNEIKINAPRRPDVLRIRLDEYGRYITKDNPYFPDGYFLTKITDSLFFLGLRERSSFIEENYFKKSNIPFTIQPSPEINGVKYIISSENIEIII